MEEKKDSPAYGAIATTALMIASIAIAIVVTRVLFWLLGMV